MSPPSHATSEIRRQMRRLRLKGLRLAALVLGIQAGIGVLAVVVVAGLAGPRSALAAMAGALIAVVPGFYFAIRALRSTPEATPKQVVNAFYKGEFGKFALTALGFAGAVILLPEQFLPMILTYMACLAAYWLAIALN